MIRNRLDRVAVGQHLVVGNDDERLDVQRLELDAVLQRAEVVADVERPGRPIAGQHAVALRVFEEIRTERLRSANRLLERPSADLARDVGIAPNTAKRWLSVLAATEQVFLLEPYHRQRRKRLIKAPKLLFTDSGLAAYLAQFRTPDTTLWGALLETWVAQNVSSILEAHLPQAELSYWHEQGRHEVDLVIESAGRVYALEVKAATRWSDSDLSGLRAFLDRTPQCEAAILAYNGRSVASLSPKLWAIPLGHLLA